MPSNDLGFAIATWLTRMARVETDERMTYPKRSGLALGTDTGKHHEHDSSPRCPG